MRPPAFPPSQPRKRPEQVDAELAELTQEEPGPIEPARPAEPDPVSTRLKERLEELRGAERRARYRTLGLAAAAIAVLAALVWLVAFSPVLALDPDEIEISGTNEYITTEDVLEILDPYAQVPLIRIDASGLREELTDHYAVKAVDLARVWPHGVKVSLDARIPVAASPKGEKFTILDGDGVELGTSKKAPKGLPVIKVDHEAEDLPETLTAVLEVMDALPPELLEQVKSVAAANPDEVEFTLGEGAKVIWGSALDLELKTSVLEVLLEVPAKVYNVTSPLSPITS